MNSRIFLAILRYSISRPGFFERHWCLLKGLAFYPFLYQRLRAGGRATIQAGVQPGEDIYPLF